MAGPLARELEVATAAAEALSPRVVSASAALSAAEAEGLLQQQLLGAFPTDGCLGAAIHASEPASGEERVWIVEASLEQPSSGPRGRTLAIALVAAGQPVLGVVRAVDAPDDLGETFAWAQGCGPLRRAGQPVVRDAWPAELDPHASVLLWQGAEEHPVGALAAVAPARFVGVPSLAHRLALVAAGDGAAAVGINGPRVWSYAAGHALLRAVGGVLVDEDGREVTYDRRGWHACRVCVGGAPSIVGVLARRQWAIVEGSGYADAAAPAALRPSLVVPVRCSDPQVLQRAQGCLLGQLAGDALGALVEFASSASIAVQYPDGGPRLLADGGPHQIMAGQPTDDSELALLLARTLVAARDFDLEAIATAYARWYRGWTHGQPGERCAHEWCLPFDVGGTTSQALGAVTAMDVQEGTAAEAARRAASHASQANGALMRISPLGIWGWNVASSSLSLDELAAFARAEARLTHPHPVCQDASAVFCVAIADAVRAGGEPQAVYGRVLDWARRADLEPAVLEAVQAAAAGPPGDYLRQQGWVLIALQNAFFQSLHTRSVGDGLVATVRAGGDTDTNAAICGALLGAIHGRDAIPPQWQRMVRSCRPLRGSAHVRQPRPAVYWPTDALALAERLLA